MTAPHEVRWKHGRRWRYGLWRNEARSADGSLSVGELERRHDVQAVRIRSLMPSRVEILHGGPRGGDRWVAAPDCLGAET